MSAVAVPAGIRYLSGIEEAALSPQRNLRNLVHELRQPLGAIEAIAYYLEMTLPAAQHDAKQHLLRLQTLVEHANDLLVAAMKD
jgi:hypothetical protein